MAYRLQRNKETVDLILYRDVYVYGENLAVFAETTEGEPYATITVNLRDKHLKENEAYIDTNNCPWLLAFLKKYDIAKPTGVSQPCGFWCYPLYEFDFNKLEKGGEF